MKRVHFSRKKSILQRLLTAIRVSIAHVGLVLLSSMYTLLGALFFYHLEDPEERIVRNATMHHLRAKREAIIEQLWSRSQNASLETEIDWKTKAEKELLIMMQSMYEPFVRKHLLPADLEMNNGTGKTRWTLASSLFFAWTSITTIGYGHIVPRTTVGRVGCLIYALMGIPLILVTIADLGRFLSKAVIWFHDGCLKILSWIKSMLSTHCSTGHGKKRRQSLLMSGESEEKAEKPEKRVSVLFVMLLLIFYTAGGALMIRSWEKWSFFDAFYFCFVTITTIGFGDIVSEEESVYFWAIFVYIILGLTLTTMCVDMLGSEYLGDIHFYGRNLGRMTKRFGIRTQDTIVSLLQKTFGMTLDQISIKFLIPNCLFSGELERMPEEELDEYLLECIRMGILPEFKWPLARPYIPRDIRKLRWADQESSMISSIDNGSIFTTMGAGEHPELEPPKIRRLDLPAESNPQSNAPSPRDFDVYEAESLL